MNSQVRPLKSLNTGSDVMVLPPYLHGSEAGSATFGLVVGFVHPGVPSREAQLTGSPMKAES